MNLESNGKGEREREMAAINQRCSTSWVIFERRAVADEAAAAVVAAVAVGADAAVAVLAVLVERALARPALD